MPFKKGESGNPKGPSQGPTAFGIQSSVSSGAAPAPLAVYWAELVDESTVVVAIDEIVLSKAIEARQHQLPVGMRRRSPRGVARMRSLVVIGYAGPSYILEGRRWWVDLA